MKELISLTEKLADPNLKGENLDILGLPIPPTLGEIGVFGVAVSLYQSSKAVSDYIFSRSFENFTKELSSLTLDQKSKFFDKYSNKNIQDFGEQALLMLNKIETPLSAKMIGKAHYLLVINEINQEIYLNYCFIIKQLNLYLLKKLKSIFQECNEKPEYGGLYTTLFNLGLMQEAEQKLYPGSLPPKAYTQSIFGWEFYNHIIKPFVNEI